MTSEELKQVHEEVTSEIKKKYGNDKFEWVNNLDPNVTFGVARGQTFDLPQWAIDIIHDFEELIVKHPLTNCKTH